MRHPGDSTAGQPASQGSGRHRDSAGRGASGRRGQPANRPDPGQPGTGSSVFGPGYRSQRPDGGAAAGGPGSGSRPGGGRTGAGRHGTGGPAAWPGSAAEATVSKGPVWGFPPAPGQPAPLYPPGQFAAWNRMSAARGAIAGSRPGGHAAGRPGDGAVAGAYGTGRPRGGSYSDSGYRTDGYAADGYGADGYDAGGYGADGHGDEVYQPDYSALAVSDPAADVTSTQTWQVISDSPDGPGAWTSPRGPVAAEGVAADRVAGAPVAAVPVAVVPVAGVRVAGVPAAADPVAAAANAAGEAEAEAEAPAARALPAPGGPHSGAGPGRTRNRAAGSRGSGRHGSDPAGAEGRAAGSRAASRAGSRSGRSSRRGRPTSAVLAVCAVLVAAVGAGAFLLHAAEHQGAPATADRSAAAPSTAAASPSPTLGQFGHIASRAADPLPLTVAQLFPDTFTVGGVVFSRTTSEPKDTCTSGVIGTALQAAVPAGTCSQVVRASYLASAEKAMGTIGVLNLSTAATAAHAGHAADTGDFIAQLKGPSGPTRALGQGAGLEEAATKGHYLILIWAQFVNSASPKSPAQQAQLKNFMTQLFDETANVSLSNRMVSGTP
jgi:hypothetical protein